MRKIFVMSVMLFSVTVASAQIKISAEATNIERYAAAELQRYYFQLFGQSIDIVSSGDASFVLGTSKPALLAQLLQNGVTIEGNLGAQSYAIKSFGSESARQIAIIGGDDVGLLYGVYGLLEDHLGMRFYFTGDVLPEKRPSEQMPAINDQRTPQMYIRGFLPWTNFPQSATIYSWNDWRYIIDQCTKMRMNFIMFHNYNGFGNHNEMAHNFEYNDHLSRGWMPTIKTGHGWACPGWEINQYRFGADQIYDDYDFGADYGLHNETLSNSQIQSKGTSIFRNVIDYAHSRGVKLGIGLDIDVVLGEYGVDAVNSQLVKAQAENIATEYPELDYLLCFQSESTKDSVFYARWESIFDGFYRHIKAHAPKTKIAVSGWGMTAESVSKLPSDVICAPISHYSPSCESGEIYGDREYWGCPWLERDFNSSQYYYPYNVNLSQTIEAYKNRAPNMKGFYALTWRLADAISPKMWYISKAPWYSDTELESSYKVYNDYARANYGEAVAETITEIINQNEPFATDFAECQSTPGFNTKVNDYALLNVLGFTVGSNAIKAVSYSDKKGTQDSPLDGGRACIGYIYEGCWLRYDSVDFGRRADSIALEVASASSGGRVAVRLDELSSEPIATFDVHNTEGWTSWRTIKCAIDPIQGKHTLYITFSQYEALADSKSFAESQLRVIDSCIRITADAGQRYRLGHLRERILATDLHIALNNEFDNYSWDDFPGKLAPWARSFLRRIDDLSSKGNVMSTQNRFIQLNYVNKVEALRRNQQVKSPSNIFAQGTTDGAVVRWVNRNSDQREFRIYRNAEQIATVPAGESQFIDRWSGMARYSVSVVDTDGRESKRGIASECAAASADIQAPIVVYTSPLQSLPIGQPLPIKFALVDNRVADELSAVVYYRAIGTQVWRKANCLHRVRSVFATDIAAASIPAQGVEYYIEATDGANTTTYPAGAPTVTLTAITYGNQTVAPKAPTIEIGPNTTIQWNGTDEAMWYRIYRSRSATFAVGSVSLVTFVPSECRQFQDNGFDFDGKPLIGKYYYRVTVINRSDHESAPSKAVMLNY